MKNYILGLIVMISPLLAFGHNPLSSKYQFIAGEKASIVSINLSQSGVHAVMNKILEPSALQSMTQTEMENWIVKYVKDNFSLKINDKQLKLVQGGIKLGSHQTDLKFVLAPLTEELRLIEVDISAFMENDQHQTIFSYSIGENSAYLILNAQNDYHSEVKFNRSSTDLTWSWLSISLIIGLLAIVLVRFQFRDLGLHYSMMKG